MKQEMSFIRTSCQILGLDSLAMVRLIQKEVEDNKMKQPRKVMEHLQARLRELADRVEKHKRPTPNPAGCTRTGNPMGASAHSLANLTGCAEAVAAQYSKGIKAGMKAMENAKLDYKNTIDRLAKACRWKTGTTDDWTRRGEMVCGDLLQKAEVALKEAEEREEAEAKIRIMETQCEELANLTVQTGKQIPAEAEVKVLEELEEEMDHREEMVEALGQALKDAVPESLKDRMEEAMRESNAAATKGRRYVDHVRARLDFSKDSESSSSKAAAVAAPGGWQTAAEELGEELEVGPEDEESGRPTGGLETGGGPGRETAGTRGTAPRYLVEFMRNFGQMRANDSGWPTFDGRYVSYPRFKKEWGAYRQTYHSAVSDDLAARTLRDKCLQGDALRMVNHLDDLGEMWETLDTCYERPDKYAEEALKPIVDFRRYKTVDSAAVREFYSLVRAAIKGARRIGRVELLINYQTIPKIMGKMPPADWKEWATRRPDWARQDATAVFEDFIERKWLDALNITATEPAPRREEGEKATGGARVPDKVSGGEKGAMRLTRAVNMIEREEVSRSPSPQWSLSFRRKCRARNLIGCDGNHVMLQCDKLLSLGLAERRNTLEKSGLCMFCLKHSADLECYGKGGLSKPRCTHPGCDGEHTPGVHRLMGEDNAGVNHLAGGEDETEGECGYKWEYEDGGWWVGTVGVEETLGETEGAPCTTTGPGLAQGSTQDTEEDDCQVMWEHNFQVSKCSEGEMAGDEWWDSELDCPHLEEGETHALQAGPRQRLLDGRTRPPRSVGAGQQRLRKRPRVTTEQQWEEARRDIWLRQALSDDTSDEDEGEERHGRFAESGKWVSELYGPPQLPTTTSGGECSG